MINCSKSNILCKAFQNYREQSRRGSLLQNAEIRHEHEANCFRVLKIIQFMQLRITETDPGARGATASGRVSKPAKLETGAEIQVPIFCNEGELLRVDTRTGEYDSRVKE